MPSNTRTLVGLGCTAVGGILAGVCYAHFRRSLLQAAKLSLTLPKIYIITKHEDWNAVSKEFLKHCHMTRVIGMDCEWVTKTSQTARRPIALLQLAVSQDICLLLRLNILKDNVPIELTNLLKDESVLKVGVAICDDSKKLFQDYGFVVKGCLDLRYIVDKVPKFANLEAKGLRQLVKTTLDYEMDKSLEIRCSDWESPELSPRQIKYAAEDSVGSALVFKYLVTYSQLSWYRLTLPTDEECLNAVIKLCGDKIERAYKEKSKSRSPPKKILQSVSTNAARSYSTRSKPLYYNSQLQAPDGEPLCTCDVSKAQWYLDRELGYMVSKEPFIVRLKFEPSGRPILDNTYYIREKENRCVVCGETENVVRKTVVPREYRKYFPLLMKNHLCHDILLLCVPCHVKSNSYDSVLRYQLAKECDAPIGCEDDVKYREDPELKKVRSAGRALLNSKCKLPESRVQELERIIREYFKIEDNEPLSESIILEANDAQAILKNNEYLPHGKKVVEVKSTDGGLMALESRWRKHFLDTMQPQFLPEMWSIDHNHERLRLQVKSGKETNFDPSILG